MALATVRQRPMWQRSLHVGILRKEDQYRHSLCPARFRPFRTTATSGHHFDTTSDSSLPLGSGGELEVQSDTPKKDNPNAMKVSSRLKKEGFLAAAGFDDDSLMVEDGESSTWSGGAVMRNEKASIAPPQSRPRPPRRPLPKSPNQVAMEEFAALERKLAGGAAKNKVKVIKSPEQMAMEEFAALEATIDGGGGGEFGEGKRKAARPSKLLAKPRVSHDCVYLEGNKTLMCA